MGKRSFKVMSFPIPRNKYRFQLNLPAGAKVIGILMEPDQWYGVSVRIDRVEKRKEARTFLFVLTEDGFTLGHDEEDVPIASIGRRHLFEVVKKQ